jgi:glycosyltransferase involved in cell wall biosynthesis
MKVLVSGAMNTVTGYGNDTIELCRALLRWGCDVSVHPASIYPPIPIETSAILTKPIPSTVDLAITHRCPQELASVEASGMRSMAIVSLAWSMWEFPSLSNSSAYVINNLRERLSSFDALLAYDPVSCEALSPFHKKTHILQGGVAPLSKLSRDWFESTFRYCMLGVLSPRKNPWAAIRAFKDLRSEGELQNSELILKTVVPGLPAKLEQWCPGLKIIKQAWPEEQISSFYANCHAMIAPSRGEGKNIPAVQFATSGGAVAATQVGGHAQWLSNDVGFPLRWEWQDSVDGRGALVDQNHLKETMLRLYTDRAEARQRGECAARTLPAMVSWDRVLDRLCNMLPSLAGRRGEEVAEKMQTCRQGSPGMLWGREERRRKLGSGHRI